MAPLRVLICEDSATYAAALTRVLEHDEDITVVAVCSTRRRLCPHCPAPRPTL